MYSEYATAYARLLASKHERGPGLEQGEELEATEVADRAAAIALAHQYLDRHAAEAVGRTASKSTFARRREVCGSAGRWNGPAPVR